MPRAGEMSHHVSPQKTRCPGHGDLHRSALLLSRHQRGLIKGRSSDWPRPLRRRLQSLYFGVDQDRQQATCQLSSPPSRSIEPTDPRLPRVDQNMPVTLGLDRLTRRRPVRQRLLPFLDRSRRRVRFFKTAILFLTLLAICTLVAASSSGRFYLLNSAAAMRDTALAAAFRSRARSRLSSKQSGPISASGASNRRRRS